MKRKSRMLKNFIMFLMVAALIGGVYYTTFYTTLFHIKNINVQDNQLVSYEEIIFFSGLDQPINYFELNQYELKDKLLAHPQIKNASVSKVFPNMVEIRIVERVPNVAVLYSETYLLVDGDMVVVEVSKTPKDLYVINGYNFENFYLGYVINDDNSDVLKNAMDLAALIEVSDILIRPSINIVEDNITICFNDKYKALFGKGENIENKYNDMLAIYKEQKKNNNSEGIINVSFDGQATFQSYRE